MKKELLTLLLLLVTTFPLSARERRENHSMPLREIDRPLTLPQRMSQVSGGYTVGFSWNNESNVHDIVFPFVEGYRFEAYRAGRPSLFVPDYSYGFNDSLQLSFRSGMPCLHYQFLNNTSVVDSEVSIRNSSLAVFLGLGALAYMSLNDRFDFAVTAGVEGKFPQTDWFWINGEFSVLAGSMSYMDITLFPSLGFQITDKFAIIPGAGAIAHLDFADRFYTYPQANMVFDLNFSDRFGTDFFFDVRDDQEATDFSGGFTLHFTW